MIGELYPGEFDAMEHNGRMDALVQEPCEDAISRQSVLNALYALCDTGETLKENPWRDNPHIDAVVETIEELPPVNLRSLNPEADREASKAYCAECDHVEMCSWYPHDGCEWLKTDRYNAGYNAAKREIVLSGEYERAYERGKADAQTKTGHWIDSPNGYFTQCSECGLHGAIGIYKHYGWCPKCGAKMVEPQEREG